VTAAAAGCFVNTVPIGALQTTGGSNTVSPTAVSLCATVLPGAAAIPTLSEWAMILLGLLIAFAAYRALRLR
jgi:hypothetical protein